ncbi:MAG: PaaI family thioesterase [Solimonas sp.]
MDLAQLNAVIDASPFNRWLGQRVSHIGDDGIEVQVPWREDFVGGATTRHLHGGVLSALVNSCGCYAIAARLGRTVPTVDLRCDFHRPAKPGDLLVKARVLKLGGTLATADVAIHAADGTLLASGRATYLTRP